MQRGQGERSCINRNILWRHEPKRREQSCSKEKPDTCNDAKRIICLHAHAPSKCANEGDGKRLYILFAASAQFSGPHEHITKARRQKTMDDMTTPTEHAACVGHQWFIHDLLLPGRVAAGTKGSARRMTWRLCHACRAVEPITCSNCHIKTNFMAISC